MGIFEKLFKTKHKIEANTLDNESDKFKSEGDVEEKEQAGSQEDEQGSTDAADESSNNVVDVGGENKNENQVEHHTAEINTVRQFIDALKWSYDEAEQKNDHDIACKLGRQIVKIEAGVNISGDSADNIYVRSMSDGVLGLFNTVSEEVDISKEMLSDFNTDKSLIMEVFAHEVRAHKKDGILNEGLTQERVTQITDTSSNIYASERNEVKRTFYKEGVKKAIELHDMDNPEKLIGYYLEVEMKDEVNNTKIKEYTVMSEADRKKSLEKDARAWDGKFSGYLKKGIKELYERLDSGYIKKKCIRTVQDRVSG